MITPYISDFPLPDSLYRQALVYGRANSGAVWVSGLRVVTPLPAMPLPFDIRSPLPETDTAGTISVWRQANTPPASTAGSIMQGPDTIGECLCETLSLVGRLWERLRLVRGLVFKGTTSTVVSISFRLKVGSDFFSDHQTVGGVCIRGGCYVLDTFLALFPLCVRGATFCVPRMEGKSGMSHYYVTTCRQIRSEARSTTHPSLTSQEGRFALERK